MTRNIQMISVITNERINSTVQVPTFTSKCAVKYICMQIEITSIKKCKKCDNKVSIRAKFHKYTYIHVQTHIYIYIYSNNMYVATGCSEAGKI